MTTITASGAQERTRNPLRPARLADVIGQDNAKALMRAALISSFKRVEPLPHTLLIGQSGTGKSTFSHVLANEFESEVFEVEAPVSFDTLMELRNVMQDFDILKIEEIHMQAVQERRGMNGNTRPEVLFSLLEDGVITTPEGVVDFPRITIIGTTTDEGMLPDPFINRFTLRPVLDPYTHDELCTIVRYNARTLGLRITDEAVGIFAGACRGVPREINNLVKNALMLDDVRCDGAIAAQVLSMNRLTHDGLTQAMQAMLTQLYTKCRRESKGEVMYQASVGTIATLIGKSRDQKAVALRVEPFLIDRGFVQVGHRGRFLTDAGIRRAQELLA